MRIEENRGKCENKKVMAKKTTTNAKKSLERPAKKEAPQEPRHRLHADTKRSILGIVFLGLALIFILAWLGVAGPVGASMYGVLLQLFGYGYFILPATMLLVAGIFLMSHTQKYPALTFVGAGLVMLASLGLADIVRDGKGGWLGVIFGSFKLPFGQVGGFIINVVILAVAVLVATNVPLRIRLPRKEEGRIAEGEEGEVPDVDELVVPEKKGRAQSEPKEEKKEELVVSGMTDASEDKKNAPRIELKFKDYVPPPIELLESGFEKPDSGKIGDKANAIKKTLENFGISVDMGEINIGPTFTRFTLRPAPGVKLSRIVSLSSDLALAIEAPSIRIEAPIPGKALVGIEVPNKKSAVVRLGSIVAYPDFNKDAMSVCVGLDVNGEPSFSNISTMPHLLVAGATGTGKSVFMHSLLISLIYKNSPANLQFAMIDPKRVELSLYDGLPHLKFPVVTDMKKALGVFRWAIEQMDERYQLFMTLRKQNLASYNADHKEEPLPNIVIVVDEMADLMQRHGREVEGAILRLAQMGRATGVHLVLATQRPEVSVVTGLIKANIPHRVALKTTSVTDSRTILDASGADKLIGNGDLLYVSPKSATPRRLQGAFLSEKEIKDVVDFVEENNRPIKVEVKEEGDTQLEEMSKKQIPGEVLDEYLAADDVDELYESAVMEVSLAKRASTSFLQRKLGVGYARAAKLIDQMEQNGLVGPGEGAKPREIFIDRFPEQTQ